MTHTQARILLDLNCFVSGYLLQSKCRGVRYDRILALLSLIEVCCRSPLHFNYHLSSFVTNPGVSSSSMHAM
eukprot:scaffold670_cov333-Pavlova_lutheri.AAC.32